MAAPVRLTKGTKEYVPIKVIDALNALTTLTGADLRFDLYLADDAETPISINSTAGNSGMTALPLIDTALLVEGKYNLYISFVASPEIVRLGPFRFWVDD